MLLIGLAGCWTSTASQEPSSPVNDPIATISVVNGGPQRPVETGPRSRTAFPMHSVWEGTYICAQGLTAVKLILDAKPTGEATAIYEFGPVASNASVPEGSFEMTGKLTAIGQSEFIGDFTPAAWIKHPPTYVSVAITIEAKGSDMEGVIASPNCRDFKVRRVE